MSYEDLSTDEKLDRLLQSNEKIVEGMDVLKRQATSANVDAGLTGAAAGGVVAVTVALIRNAFGT